jgi:hypothetical protein
VKRALLVALAACSGRADEPRDPPPPAPAPARAVMDARSAEADVLARSLDADGRVPAALRRAPAPIAGDAVHLPDDARQRALQGAWLLNENHTLTAFVFDGDHVRTWDGAVEKTYTLRLSEPCELSLFEGDSGHSYSLGLRKGVATFGLGTAGQVAGGDAIACELGTYYFEHGRCRYLRPGAHPDDAERAKCALANDTFTFTSPSFGDTYTLHAADDLLWDDQLAKEHAEPVVDYATAAAIVTDQPAAVAIRAGGKIGDTSTVAGLVATVALGRAGMIGRSVDVSGIVLETASTEMNGERTDYVDLHTPKDFFHPGVTCMTKGSPLGVVHPDQVIRVRGRVEKVDADGVVTLRPCTLLP